MNMLGKKIKDLYRSTKFEIKYFFKNLGFVKKLSAQYYLKKSNYYKKQYNFILTREFMQKFNCGEVEKNILDCGIDLFHLEDVYIQNFGECAFVSKYGSDGKAYTLKESAGIIKRLEAPEMRFGKVLNLKKDVIEEDEICLACFMLGFNYWHFTCDIMPRIMLMEKLGYKGKYLINNRGQAEEFLDLMSIPRERIIVSERNRVIHAKKLHMFDESFGIELSGKWLSDTRDFIMEKLEQKNGKLLDENYPKKIYISRIGTRRIINEGQIIEFLKPKGFAIIVPEKISIAEQIKLFANADIIVTPHGANATNVLYSKKGTSFVECFGHYWVNPCMVTTVDLLNLDYHMICERFMHNIPNGGQYSNYIIDMTLFTCKINKILEFRYGNSLTPSGAVNS